MLHFGRTPWRSHRSHRPVLTCRRLKRITRRGVRCPAPRALCCAGNKSFNKRAHKLCFDSQEIQNEFFVNVAFKFIVHYKIDSLCYHKDIEKSNIAEKPPRSRNFVFKYKKLKSWGYISFQTWLCNMPTVSL